MANTFDGGPKITVFFFLLFPRLVLVVQGWITRAMYLCLYYLAMYYSQKLVCQVRWV